MSFQEPPMPRLSPQPSEEDTPTISLIQKKRKRKQSSFLLGKRDKPKVIQDAATSGDQSETSESNLEEVSTSRAQGPDLRLLPQESGDEDASTITGLSSKFDRYVQLPQEDPELPSVLHPVTESRIKFEWDYVMEHQRGFRFLWTPLFSQAGLLPTDPPAFSTLSADPLPCSLDDFQLPSPEWQWMGEGWCVDMRGDGEVQEDGFEYNWWFRKKGWRPTIGFLSAGAFVRRRRWMRLKYLLPPESILEKLPSPPFLPRKTEELSGWEVLKIRLREAALDRERLEIVKAWLDETSGNEEILRTFWTEVMCMLVFPSSCDLLRNMMKSMGWETLPPRDEVMFWNGPP
ncbi:hypothetical protein DACRYDRAFT_22443 [Dacryopinax primogenitus]|uniref:Peroxin domain-containing protein n=1 Tax=Dacryopinax primogenitus (strain DJM 731) TaxID=1858805 RepID=M5FZX4_DACPD|nr:uncharacterized protein DACRYDRAFT_22443 [Dacryopinax primogenitus]EJU02059.1 hypothetical protein DACRYDRAFT_22443 [Dacryopinax primogenitus]